MGYGVDNDNDNIEELWVLSNRYFNFILGKVNFDEINFRIMTGPVSIIVQNTTCAGNLYNIGDDEQRSSEEARYSFNNTMKNIWDAIRKFIKNLSIVIQSALGLQ